MYSGFNMANSTTCSGNRYILTDSSSGALRTHTHPPIPANTTVPIHSFCSLLMWTHVSSAALHTHTSLNPFLNRTPSLRAETLVTRDKISHTHTCVCVIQKLGQFKWGEKLPCVYCANLSLPRLCLFCLVHFMQKIKSAAFYSEVNFIETSWLLFHTCLLS